MPPRRRRKAAKAPTRIEIEYVPIGALKPDPANPRKMSEAEAKKLERSLGEFGTVEPIVARREDGLVIGGHQRLAAATALGHEEVPVVYLDGIDDARARTLNLALNKISGAWDVGKLTSIVEELSTVPDLDLTLSGFDLPELEKLGAADTPRDRGLPQTVISYSLIFDNEEQQERWFAFLRDLKAKNAGATIAERLDSFLVEQWSG